jgi:peptidyl-prolyl cis-trans isomerase C
MKGRTWAWGGLAGLALASLAGPAGAQTISTTGPGQAAPVVAAGAASSEQTVALVNGQEITRTELEAAIKASGVNLTGLNDTQRRQRQVEVLGMMIDMMLMHQFLEQYAPPVPAEDVDRQLGEMREGLRTQGKTLEEFCHDTNQSLAQFRASLADAMRWMRYAQSQINDPALEQYYRDNKDYFDQVQVRASHIVLRVPPGLPDAEKATLRAQLAQLRQQIVEGKMDFAEAAKKYSQDPRAAQGGDLDFFHRKFFDEPFGRAAFALAPGQVSDVVETDYGLHLIKMTERKPGTPSDYARIKERVRDAYGDEMRQQVLDHLRKKAVIRITPP